MLVLSRKAFLGAAASLLALDSSTPPEEGCFDGDAKPKTVWEFHKEHEWKVDRQMTMLEPFSFTDSKGNKWTTPKNYTIDGASIPRFLWPIPGIGTPFVNDFRRSTVIHDYYCDKNNIINNKKTHEEVDEAFYEMMLADGLKEEKARLIAGVVHLFNKWPDPNVAN